MVQPELEKLLAICRLAHCVLEKRFGILHA
jgi:hypothetical protein